MLSVSEDNNNKSQVLSIALQYARNYVEHLILVTSANL